MKKSRTKKGGTLADAVRDEFVRRFRLYADLRDAVDAVAGAQSIDAPDYKGQFIRLRFLRRHWQAVLDALTAIDFPR